MRVFLGRENPLQFFFYYFFKVCACKIRESSQRNFIGEVAIERKFNMIRLKIAAILFISLISMKWVYADCEHGIGAKMQAKWGCNKKTVIAKGVLRPINVFLNTTIKIK